MNKRLFSIVLIILVLLSNVLTASASLGKDFESSWGDEEDTIFNDDSEVFELDNDSGIVLSDDTETDEELIEWIKLEDIKKPETFLTYNSSGYPAFGCNFYIRTSSNSKYGAIASIGYYFKIQSGLYTWLYMNNVSANVKTEFNSQVITDTTKIDDYWYRESKIQVIFTMPPSWTSEKAGVLYGKTRPLESNSHIYKSGSSYLMNNIFFFIDKEHIADVDNIDFFGYSDYFSLYENGIPVRETVSIPRASIVDGYNCISLLLSTPSTVYCSVLLSDEGEVFVNEDNIVSFPVGIEAGNSNWGSTFGEYELDLSDCGVDDSYDVVFEYNGVEYTMAKNGSKYKLPVITDTGGVKSGTGTVKFVQSNTDNRVVNVGVTTSLSTKFKQNLSYVIGGIKSSQCVHDFMDDFRDTPVFVQQGEIVDVKIKLPSGNLDSYELVVPSTLDVISVDGDAIINRGVDGTRIIGNSADLRYLKLKVNTLQNDKYTLNCDLRVQRISSSDNPVLVSIPIDIAVPIKVYFNHALANVALIDCDKPGVKWEKEELFADVGNYITWHVEYEVTVPSGYEEYIAITQQRITDGVVDATDIREDLDLYGDIHQVVRDVDKVVYKLWVTANGRDIEANSITLNPNREGGISNVSITKQQSLDGKSYTDKKISSVGNTDIYYKVHIVNTGDLELTGIKVSDVLPTGITFKSATIDGVPKTPDENGTYSIERLAVGEESILMIVGVADSDVASVFKNQASVTSKEITIPVNSNEVELELTKTNEVVVEKYQSLNDSHYTKGELYAVKGDKLSYKFVVTNEGTVDLKDVYLKDVIPEGFIPDSVVGETYVSDKLSIPKESSIELYLTGVVGIESGTITNKCSIYGSEIDGEIESNEVVVDVEETHTPHPLLEIEKFQLLNDGDFTKDVLEANKTDTLQYRIVVTNTGDAEAKNVKISDILPVGVVDAEWYLEDDTKISLDNTYDLGVGDSITYICKAKIDGTEDIIKNVASVQADGVPPVESNDVIIHLKDDESEEPKLPSISIEKLQSTDNINWTKEKLQLKFGDDLHYRLRVTNTGEIDLHDVKVYDKLPDGCSDGRDLEFSLGTLLVGETKDIDISGKVTKEGVLVNRGSVESLELPIPVISNDVEVVVVRDENPDDNPDEPEEPDIPKDPDSPGEDPENPDETPEDPNDSLKVTISTNDGTKVPVKLEVNITKISPKTGDTTNILGWCCLLILSAYFIASRYRRYRV